MNLVILIGRLGKEPDVKYLQSGTMVSSFSIATSDSYKDKSGEKVEKTEWHNITAFGKLAEICGNYLKKGSKVFCMGRSETQSWENKEGVKQYKTVVILEKMEMLDGKKQETGNAAPLDDSDIPL
jgi:single-strand DNA-binding protein